MVDCSFDRFALKLILQLQTMNELISDDVFMVKFL